MEATGGGAPRPAARLAVGTALVAGAVTIAVALVPYLSFAYRAPALRAVLETANAVVALVVAFLIYGRFRLGRRLQDLLLVLALCTVAVANLALTALPSAVALARGEEFSRWEGLAIRLLGTVVLAVAALVPPRITVRSRTAATAAAGTAAAVTVLCVTGLLLGSDLPPTVDPAIGLADASAPRLVAHPIVLGVQAVGAVLYAVAAVAFTRQSARTADPMLRWVGAACVLAAAARVHYLLFPSLYSDFVHTGDLLRLGFYLLLLVGAAAEIRSFWELRVEAALSDERRRTARELHDGIVQEVGYIRSESHRLPPAAPGRTQIMEACDRALDEARALIQALGHVPDEPLDRMVRRAARELAHRYGADVPVEVLDDVPVDREQAHALLRITREAVANAVRHGRARTVRIRLRRSGDRRCLTIQDDGTGFDVGATTAAPGGYGLVSMRERASALPGAMEIESAPGAGSVVRVRW